MPGEFCKLLNIFSPNQASRFFMKKYFLITALFVGSNLVAYSQSPDQVKDSLKIDSLKKLLPSFKGTDRVNCMTLICEYYSDIASSPGIKAFDSIRYYGNKILNESKALGYKKGIAMGSLSSSPDSLKERNAKEAIRIGEEIGSDEVLGWGYSVLISTTTDTGQIDAYYKKAIAHFKKAGKTIRAAALSNWVCQGYLSTGENEKAFDYAKNNLEILKSMSSSEFASAYSWAFLWSLWNMSNLYSAAGDYEGALNFMRMANEVDRVNHGKTTWGGFTLDISSIFTQIGQYDSAMLYWNRFRNEAWWDNPSSWRPGKMLAYNYLAGIHIRNKQYDKAIEILTNNNIYFDSLLKYSTGNYKNAGNYGKMAASLSLSDVYEAKKNYEKALQYAKEGLSQAKEKNRRPEMMQSYQLLSTAYHHLRNNDSAYEYLQKYIVIKDSIQSRQFLLRMYNSKKEVEDEMKKAQLGFLMKDNKIKQQQLKEEAMLKNFLFIFLVVLVGASIFIFRSLTLKRKNEKLKNEKQQAELQERATRLEMQALRAQMNPHFIFNCLSSINCFILENETEKASDYLTRFSRLIRLVLTNSEKPLITLDEELKMLRLYLDMERLRFENSFDYNITYTNDVEAGSVLVPPLLLQPFCENAIWHGLMHKEGQGHLNISFMKEDEYLNCVITDDGIGRSKAGELNTGSAKKEVSRGLKITTERLSLFNQNKEVHTFYEIDDVVDENGAIAGTKVSIKIRHKNLMEAVA
jgi:tetratricopeptide (TPR) repeat protein